MLQNLQPNLGHSSLPPPLESIAVPPAATGRFVRESGILWILLEIGRAWIDGMVFGPNWPT